MLGKLPLLFLEKHSWSLMQAINRLMISAPNSFCKLHSVLPRSNGHGWETRALPTKVMHIEKKGACLPSQPGFMVPFLSFFSLSFKVGTTRYMQPLVKWALIPFEASRCYCHTNKPWAGNSLTCSQPVGSRATPSVLSLPASAQAVRGSATSQPFSISPG